MRRAALEVGDRVRVRTDGGTAAAWKYAGRGGRVEEIATGLDNVHQIYVRVDGNDFETAFEERDLVPGVLNGWVPGMGSIRRR